MDRGLERIIFLCYNTIKSRKTTANTLGGGYILAPAHNIQPDTPPENVVAMYKAAEKYGRYQ